MPDLTRIPAFDVLKNGDFRNLWTVKVVNEVSRRMELLALGYLVLRMTDSPFQVGLIAVFLNLPRPFFSLFAGLVADRLDRRRVLIGVHAIYSVISTALLLLLVIGVIEPWHVFIAIFLQGSAKVLDDPSRRTAIFDLAGQERLASAMSLETINQNIGKIAGPLIGGVLIASTGFVGSYAAILALDAVSLLMISRFKLPHRPLGEGTPMQVWRSLREGLGHSMSNRMVLGVLSMSLIMNSLVFPIQYFIPVIASDLLMVGPTLGGLLGSAEGIGNFLGGVILAVRRNIGQYGRVFAIGALLVAVMVTLVAWSPWFTVSFSLLLLGGLGQAGFSTMQSTILLLESAPEMRGRTMGAQGVVNGMGHLVGGTEIGAIANAFGIGIAIGLNAGAGILMILLVMVLTPLVKRHAGVGGAANSTPMDSRTCTISASDMDDR
ncbi:MAG: MFS transporter [Chloroflexota bacterium]|nr:MFS transporter [Dehalococcoidia bacterium]MEC9271518.1 MFS transporter [Chloroflexota bacterium]MEC9447116.1 MFS transporter [Chloroflexota bacterium]